MRSVISIAGLLGAVAYPDYLSCSAAQFAVGASIMGVPLKKSEAVSLTVTRESDNAPTGGVFVQGETYKLTLGGIPGSRFALRTSHGVLSKGTYGASVAPSCPEQLKSTAAVTGDATVQWTAPCEMASLNIDMIFAQRYGAATYLASKTLPVSTAAGVGACAAPATPAPTVPATTASYCDQYCTSMMATCTTVFDTTDMCLASCSVFPSELAATSGDSVQCRIYHAGLATQAASASTDRASHCGHASPVSEGSLCGTPCDSYCDVIMDTCKSSEAQYTSKSDCMQSCKHFPAAATVPSTSGNNLECRAHHASLANVNPAVHCPHAGPTGGSGDVSICLLLCSCRLLLFTRSTCNAPINTDS
jgi:hypothetical protein